MEHYCAYQERCHAEVQQKLKEYAISTAEKDEIIVSLLQNNYLNEERFALLFAVSKFHQKKWGKVRIKNELKARQISDFLIQKALKEINPEEYEVTFEQLAAFQWEQIRETNALKKKKKFCDYLLRKGWENDRVFEKAHEFEKNAPEL
ncbi:regulatory protein RecX [Flavobacterium sp. N1719]|uniref:regulatory protein RecX n=1 Tax=Flavobacterium sp. N1719 TaxID=2885633 RepID=UPI002221737C|nr:regulatory protein RecX [Flavobacterium sp. N1719]